jgi:hypothetical protein
MPCKDVACVIDECLEACKNFPYEKIETIQTELERYKDILNAGQAHVCNWKNDDDAYKIVTRNFDGSREILQLYTRNLTVDGIETVNGLLTVNGIIALNGRLILNGVDINTVIANAAAAAAASGGGGVTSVTGGTGITITGTPTTPIVNLTVPVAIANGGTNATSMTTTDGTVIFDGTRLVTTATGTANQVLTSNGAGVAPTYQPVSASGAVTSVTGGTGINITGTATTPIVNLTIPVAIANGGTNATSMTNANGVIYYDSTQLVTTAVGTAKNALTSNGIGVAPTFQPVVSSLIGNTGSTVTPVAGAVTISGSNSGSSVKFNGGGSQLDLLVTDTNANTYVGFSSGTSGGSGNVGFGRSALSSITIGQANAAIGNFALATATSGSGNNAVGQSALGGIITGENNIGIGVTAGAFYTNTESNNIVLNSLGVLGESNTLHIGSSTGIGALQLNSAFICGIRGRTTGVVDAIPVLIDSANQLGTVSSSKRFKENIIPMPTSFSDNLLNLNPTLFNYKQDESKAQTWGLIAEEVQQIFPELVVNDQDGLPLTVKYHEMPVLLLNELIKLKKELPKMNDKIITLQNELEMLKKERAVVH